MSDYLTQCYAVTEISADLQQAMQQLYLAHYDGSNAERVAQDLADKDFALLLWHQQQLVGFTTFKVYPHGSARIVYSGDTIVEHAHWGQQSLAFAWIAKMGEIKRQQPDMPLYWFLIVKGHRTFKYLPAFGLSFYPHWKIDRSDLKPLADELAQARFGELYDSSTGIVACNLGHLKADYALPSEEELNKPAVQFFLQKNPNYQQGHELVCLCELEEFNMKPLTRRIFNKV